MKFLFLLIFINSFYIIIQPLSILVKISWQKDNLNYLALKYKSTERFNLELSGNGLKDNIIAKKTNKYDVYHFKGNDLFGENGEKINQFNLHVYFNTNKVNTINFIENIQSDSIVYITQPLNNSKYNNINIVKDKEEYYNQIINLFKYPVRILQFILKTDKNYSKIQIKCKNKEKSQQSYFNAIFDQKVDKKGKVYLTTKYIKSKVCPNDQYTVEIAGGAEITLNCEPAIYPINNPNVYLIDLQFNCNLIQQIKNIDNFENQLTQNEIDAEERIHLFDEIISIKNLNDPIGYLFYLFDYNSYYFNIEPHEYEANKNYLQEALPNDLKRGALQTLLNNFCNKINQYSKKSKEIGLMKSYILPNLPVPTFQNFPQFGLQQPQLQQNIPQSQPNQNVTRRRHQQRQRRTHQPRELGIRLESIQERIEEENITQTEEDPGSSRKGKGKNVVETQSEHSSDSEHTIPQLYGQQHLGEGSSFPGHLQGGFMGTTLTNSLTDKQTMELLAADRFNLSQGGQGLLQDVVQQTHEGGTSSTQAQQNVEGDHEQDD